jgi:hypothetical protein
MMLTEKYQNRMSELAGILNEAGRIDFLKSKFKEWADGLYRQVSKKEKIRTFNPNSEHPEGGEWSEVEATLLADLVTTFNGKLPPKSKYDKKMSEIFEQLIEADPLPNKQNAQWIIKLYTNGLILSEDLYKVNNYLTLYEKIKQAGKIPVEQRDINKFKSLPELYAVVSKFEKVEIKSKSEEAREKKLEGADRIFEDAHWLVISPKNQVAACLYGKETEWCTASDKGSNRFDYYNKQGPLYILFDKTIDADPRKNPNKKLQFHFETNQFMDANDHQLRDIGGFFKNNKQLVDLFYKLKKINNKFKLEHRLLERDEALAILKNPKERLKFIEDKHSKFGAEWVFNYLSELGATDEISKIIFEDKQFLEKLLDTEQFSELAEGFAKIYNAKAKYKDLKDDEKSVLAKFLYNNPVILQYLAKSNSSIGTMTELAKILNESGKIGNEYAKDMFLNTDTMYNIAKNQGNIIGFYNAISMKNVLGVDAISNIISRLSDKNSKYKKEYVDMYDIHAYSVLLEYLKTAQKRLNTGNKMLEETFSIGVLSDQFITEGNTYLKNIGFYPEVTS